MCSFSVDTANGLFTFLFGGRKKFSDEIDSNICSNKQITNDMTVKATVKHIDSDKSNAASQMVKNVIIDGNEKRKMC